MVDAFSSQIILQKSWNVPGTGPKSEQVTTSLRFTNKLRASKEGRKYILYLDKQCRFWGFHHSPEKKKEYLETSIWKSQKRRSILLLMVLLLLLCYQHFLSARFIRLNDKKKGAFGFALLQSLIG